MGEGRMRRTGLGLGLAAAVLGFALEAARAEDVDQPTQEAMKSIITQQIEAFGRDDAPGAEAFAAPGIKQLFPEPKDFVAMVHRSYAPLIHPRSTHFDAAASTPAGPAQKVTVVDSEGGAWTAVYTFEQVDGQWRITGCALIKEQSTTI